jgi:hypothetical protein
MRIAASARDSSKDSRHNRECPAGSDHYPSGAFGLRALQQDAGNYAVSQQYQDKCAEKFTKQGSHRVSFRAGNLVWPERQVAVRRVHSSQSVDFVTARLQ